MSSEKTHRSGYIVIGEAAVISVKSIDEAFSSETKLVAEKILREQKRVKGVYAKLETTGALRVPKLIHIAGEVVEETWYRENGIDFHVTLGKVYVNPRLSTEHLRVARFLEKVGARRVLDAFAGIGGYAFNIAVHSKSVEYLVANDINYFAFRDMLFTAARLRKRIHPHMLILRLDARELNDVLSRGFFDAILMDNPQFIDEFLDLPCGLATEKSYIILFYIAEEHEADKKLEQLSESIRCLRCTCIDKRTILDYAPHKYLYSATLLCRSK